MGFLLYHLKKNLNPLGSSSTPTFRAPYHYPRDCRVEGNFFRNWPISFP